MSVLILPVRRPLVGAQLSIVRGGDPRPLADAPSFPKITIALPGASFVDRWREAHRRRLKPNTALTIEVYAGAIGVSDKTVRNWLAGEKPGADGIDAAVRFFTKARGDSLFAQEVFGVEIDCLADVRARLREIDAAVQQYQQVSRLRA